MIDLLSQVREPLIPIIAKGNDRPAHVKAFAGRLLGTERLGEIAPRLEPFELPDLDRARYEGFPYVAALGFGVAAGHLRAEESIEPFIDGLRRIQSRYLSGAIDITADNVALLGLAEGLVGCREVGDAHQTSLFEWLLELIDSTTQPSSPYVRLRRLAGDLLDRRGRLRIQPELSDPYAVALELALQDVWPLQFGQVPSVDEAARRNLLRKAILEKWTSNRDVVDAAVHLKALDVIIDVTCLAAIPTVSETARLLSAIQPAMKRWRWEDHGRRRNTSGSRWIIDDEYDVQGLLWTVLYPVFQGDLVDETYLPSWGNVQPRADLAIRSLYLIIEVKIARAPRDFKKIEEEVAGDLGLYFKDTTLFDRMIVFVYDDCDEHQPERYGSLVEALKVRERIEDVIIIRRPSMIPDRGKRLSIGDA